MHDGDLGTINSYGAEMGRGWEGPRTPNWFVLLHCFVMRPIYVCLLSRILDYNVHTAADIVICREIYSIP